MPRWQDLLEICPLEVLGKAILRLVPRLGNHCQVTQEKAAREDMRVCALPVALHSEAVGGGSPELLAAARHSELGNGALE